LNPRPLGYEPYDVCFWCLRQSLAGVVTSADRPGPISLGRLRLPRLVLSRRVRFTNRFTEQAIDLQYPHPPPRPSVSGRGLHRDTDRTVVCPDPPRTRLLRDLTADPLSSDPPPVHLLPSRRYPIFSLRICPEKGQRRRFPDLRATALNGTTSILRAVTLLWACRIGLFIAGNLGGGFRSQLKRPAECYRKSWNVNPVARKGANLSFSTAITR